MTVIENLDFEFECDPWEAYADQSGFQRMRPNRDGLMPVGSDRARRRSHSRNLARPGRRPQWRPAGSR